MLRSFSTCVIVIGSKNEQSLSRCLDSLKHQRFKDFSVVVVGDRGMSGAVSSYKCSFGYIQLINNSIYPNITTTINLVLTAIESKFVAFISGESTADPYWLAELITELQSDTKIGSCASKVSISELPSLIKSAGLALRPRRSCWTIRGRGLPDGPAYSRVCKVVAASPDAAAFKTQAVKHVGLLSDELENDLRYAFLDLGLRLSFKGYECHYVPSSRTYDDDDAMITGAWNTKGSQSCSCSLLVSKYAPLSLICVGTFPYLVLKGYHLFRDTIALRPSKWKENPQRVKNLLSRIPQSIKRSLLAREHIRRLNVIKLISVMTDQLGIWRQQHILSRICIERDQKYIQSRHRFALVSHSHDLYGTERCLYRLATGLESAGFEPIVIVPGPGRLLVDLVREGVQVRVVPCRWWVRIGYERRSAIRLVALVVSLVIDTYRLLRIFSEEHVELVDTASSVVPQAAIAARLVGLPHVWHIREVYPNETLRPIVGHRATRKIISALSNAVIVPSDLVAQGLRFTSKIRVVPESVAPVFFESSVTSKLRAEIGADKEEVIILNIAGLYPGKDQLTAIRAVAMLNQSGLRSRLVLCGEDHNKPYKELLMKTGIELGISNRIHFLGYRNDINSLMVDADVLLIVSHSESFGLTVIEAMACGLPVISTRCGGPELLINDGFTGFLVNIGDYSTIANKVKHLIDNLELRSFIKDNAGEKANKYRPSVNLNNTLKVYSSVSGKQFTVSDSSKEKIAK